MDYQGSLLGTPVPLSGTTDYGGLSNEVQRVYRFPASRHGVEVVGGLVLDYWNRQLSADQREQYWVGALRLGVQLDRHAARGFFGGAGVKRPFWSREDAHLRDIGFSANPRLEPKGKPSLYAVAGYRIDRLWSLVAYYDTYRFGESAPTPPLLNPSVPGCAGPAGCTLVQPASRKDSFGLRLRYRF